MAASTELMQRVVKIGGNGRSKLHAPSVGRVRKGQAESMKHESWYMHCGFHTGSIDRIPKQRMTDRLHVDADLMRPSGQKMNVQEGCIFMP